MDIERYILDATAREWAAVEAARSGVFTPSSYFADEVERRAASLWCETPEANALFASRAALRASNLAQPALMRACNELNVAIEAAFSTWLQMERPELAAELAAEKAALHDDYEAASAADAAYKAALTAYHKAVEAAHRRLGALVPKALAIKAGYSGTKLYGVLRRAGLEEAICLFK